MGQMTASMSRRYANAVEVHLCERRLDGITYTRVDESWFTTTFVIYGPDDEVENVYRTLKYYEESTRLYTHRLVIPKTERAAYDLALKKVWDEPVRIPWGIGKDSVCVELTGTYEKISRLEEEIKVQKQALAS